MSKTKATGDSVRSYLRNIGRIPLLEHDEEILLGRQVQRLMELEDKRNEVKDQFNRKISDAELAEHLNVD